MDLNFELTPPLSSIPTQRLQAMSSVIEADLEEFGELQDLVSGYLYANDSSKANAM